MVEMHASVHEAKKSFISKELKTINQKLDEVQNYQSSRRRALEKNLCAANLMYLAEYKDNNQATYERRSLNLCGRSCAYVCDMFWFPATLGEQENFADKNVFAARAYWEKFESKKTEYRDTATQTDNVPCQECIRYKVFYENSEDGGEELGCDELDDIYGLDEDTEDIGGLPWEDDEAS